ncbi:toxin-antitoxin system, antitoxin component, HicB domain protein [Oribacterium sp. oral taxon 078 str. F0263]|uniref:type II toxin-antitoxin system HicB family antitoxin n=1 Tax=Oribacterium sp. oral taxon 078 TaxID=652706 RepID=UPI0003AE0963|nr:type II toxin-antitoxin system HicB family antitoxin [Oribacterium sp. oral taxon 078]ERL20516.1 toxin-antitoxin system, antitoxin component, HicB domain protein [Oribacterium sp. oral taxon 078 str. F0263]
MTYYYPAVITKKEKGGYRVDVIDLEGCYGEGADLEDALENARYAGVNWLLAESEDQSDFPMQTHLDDIRLNPGQKATMLAFLMPREGWEE